MPRYRLPAEFGGGEVHGKPCTVEGSTRPFVAVYVDGREVTLPAVILTEVKPLEPFDDWAVVLEPQGTDQGPYAFHRDPSRAMQSDGKRWYCHDLREWMTWDRVCTYGHPLPIAPKKSGTGLCPVCREVKFLRLDGRLKQHGSRSPSLACKGTGQLPGEVDE